ncbi:hypothetical protein CC1G_08988 [Coprinopsis cinerea okayama7|uniref:Uncharacterized protein n=1 Tax=Coprinopsis cinerea (strain Okayama-7 / 130 / ATCC MYA-4618 / FGSC 9003) TaxID=240176 RepID=A8N9F3_COPC7|nr:hypothetical protein CC1G_08988 [Coprinopsis cinerea okayama7\|eukprot:XP_001831459.2 hypothetical protein CC1G_08988 [Coprinopsis cinerea okayama7\
MSSPPTAISISTSVEDESEKGHSQCSEPFYKKELEAGIRAEPSKSKEERLKMLEMLKRLEEESDDHDEDEEESELARRLGSVDLDSVPADELWSMLSPAEKDKFLKAVNDPSSELAQQLLSREEIQIQQPWWTLENVYPPTKMEIPEGLLKPVSNRPLLAYNLSAIGITYAFIVRHLGASTLSSLSSEDPDFVAAHEMFSQFLPFLVDRRSTLVFPNLGAVTVDLASRFDTNVVSPDLFSALLQDASQLMSPKSITHVSTCPSDLLSQPHQLPLLVLSDMHQFVATGLAKRRISHSLRHLAHKLVFYAAHVITMPTPILRGLAHELKQKSTAFRADSKAQKQLKAALAVTSRGPQQSNGIEDLNGD